MGGWPESVCCKLGLPGCAQAGLCLPYEGVARLNPCVLCYVGPGVYVSVK